MSARRPLVFAVAAATLLIGAFVAYVTLRPDAARAKFEAVDITGADWGRGFELTDHHGKRRTLADFRGKAVTLFFGYTHCPDVCPTTMAMLGEAVRKLESEAGNVQVLFVTVDPKRDTPQVLAQYVPAFNPTFLGLYADEATTERTAKEFKVYFKAQAPNEQGSYTVDHSGQVFVFDRSGRLRLIVRSSGATADSVAHDLRLLLQEGKG
ncbi:MAG: SCO family protein [Betaproteobacteria bacterium]|nr:SCO family protein [Betaproteobacteria bacterium]